MRGLNKGLFSGWLAKDIEVRTGKDTKPFCSIRLAVPRGKKTDGQGNMVDRESLWIDATGGANLIKLYHLDDPDCQLGKKGQWVELEGEFYPRENEVEKGGKIHVYHDSVLRVANMIVAPGWGNNSTRPETANNATPNAPSELPRSNPADDMAGDDMGDDEFLTADERKASDLLPI